MTTIQLHSFLVAYHNMRANVWDCTIGIYTYEICNKKKHGGFTVRRLIRVSIRILFVFRTVVMMVNTFSAISEFFAFLSCLSCLFHWFTTVLFNFHFNHIKFSIGYNIDEYFAVANPNDGLIELLLY